METISALNCACLSNGQIRTLHANDIKTFMDLIKAPAEVVCTLLEITNADYSIIRQSVLKYAQPEPISLRQIAQPNKVTPRSTGIVGLDKMLGGGLFNGDIIELYGKTGTGKTQLCLYLTSRFCHFSDDDSCVLYFDMKNDFNAKRLHKYCNETATSLTKVKVFKEPNFEGLLSQLEDIKNQFIGGINGFYGNSRFLVVDSVPMVIYPVVQQEPYSWRFHQEQLVEKLRWLADHLNLTVILINHAVTTRPGKSSSASSAPSQPTIKAAMGKFWFHKMSTRIHLTKPKDSGNRITATLEKSGRSSEGQQFKFFITDKKLLEIA